jgi:hypothetical protein
MNLSTSIAQKTAKEARHRLQMPVPALCVHECRTWLLVAVNPYLKPSQAFHPPTVIETSYGYHQLAC